MEWLIPFFQSFARFELNSFDSLPEKEFDILPVYDIDIFSYQRSFPAACLRLNG